MSMNDSIVNNNHRTNRSEQHQNKNIAADHFIIHDGKEFAGIHLIIDMWGAKDLTDIKKMEEAMKKAVENSGATLLHIHLHHFTPDSGISGVAVLAESHISVHTWPERSYAAFDIFMCGDTTPETGVEIFKEYYQPEKIKVHKILRGATEY